MIKNCNKSVHGVMRYCIDEAVERRFGCSTCIKRESEIKKIKKNIGALMCVYVIKVSDTVVSVCKSWYECISQ